MSVLPPNSTAMELAIERIAGERVSAIPVPIGDLWNPAACPAPLLPFLAWACSVDIWDDDWSEEIKRNVIAASFTIHRQKGTVGAVKAALAALGIETAITEWWQQNPAATPHTFRVDCTVKNLLENNLPATRALANIIAMQINQVKPAREHYTLRVGEEFASNQPVRSAFAGTIVDSRAHDFFVSEPV